MMRTVLAIIFYLISAVQLTAQDRYFLAIQSENKQPFYVRVSNKTWSSSPIGNLVVHNLGDSTYQVSVGFPHNKYPEQNFLVTFNRKDLGYSLRQGNDLGWTLINWENGERLAPRTNQPIATIWYGEKKKDDAFTNLMAAVVNDSAVLYVASVKDLPGKQEVFANAAPVSTNTEAIFDSTAAIIDSTVVAAGGEKNTITDSALAIQAMSDTSSRVMGTGTGEVIIDSAVAIVNNFTPTPIHSKDSVAAINSVTDKKETTVAAEAGPILVYTAPKPNVTMVKDYILPNKGRSMVFTDSLASGTDTISVLIDAEVDSINDIAEQPVAKPAKDIQVKSSGNNPAPDTVTAIPVSEATTVKKEVTPDPEAEKKKMVLINSDCSNFATDNDVDKLRVKILDEPTIDTKLASTKKLFKSKCIYTRQIRALSELFMNDEGKYRFFEQCYPFTADTSEFRSLLSLLSEDAYIARFKTLVRIKD